MGDEAREAAAAPTRDASGDTTPSGPCAALGVACGGDVDGVATRVDEEKASREATASVSVVSVRGMAVQA